MIFDIWSALFFLYVRGTVRLQNCSCFLIKKRHLHILLYGSNFSIITFHHALNFQLRHFTTTVLHLTRMLAKMGDSILKGLNAPKTRAITRPRSYFFIFQKLGDFLCSSAHLPLDGGTAQFYRLGEPQLVDLKIFLPHWSKCTLRNKH